MYGSPSYSVSAYASHARYISTGATLTTAGAITSAVNSVDKSVTKAITTAGAITSAVGSVSTTMGVTVTGFSITSATSEIMPYWFPIEEPTTTWTGIAQGPSGSWTEIGDTSTVWADVSQGPSGSWTEIADASTIWTDTPH